MEKFSESQLSGKNKAELVAIILALYAETPVNESEEITRLTEEAEQHLAKIDELQATVVELNKSLSKSEKNSGSKVLEIDGKSYKMTAVKANFNGVIVSYELLKADQELAKEVVAAGAGYLVEITSKETEVK